ncbi:cytochrome c [Bosea sp. 117]|uniref:c-type cytochrome n=1 Tax=Bosea sp. 117 TaxID=1125973 RepID=UPI00068D9837|nr:cytochrome c [Bosea sp. 117]
MHRSTILMACALAGAAAATAGLSLAGAQTPAAGFYTQDQASQGMILFNDNCAQCHRPDLTGALGPALIGKAFLDKWGNQPLSNLYGFEHSAMPATNPGSLPDSTLLPITAYILQKNGLPAGDKPFDKTMLSRTLTAP